MGLIMALVKRRSRAIPAMMRSPAIVTTMAVMLVLYFGMIKMQPKPSSTDSKGPIPPTSPNEPSRTDIIGSPGRSIDLNDDRHDDNDQDPAGFESKSIENGDEEEPEGTAKKQQSAKRERRERQNWTKGQFRSKDQHILRHKDGGIFEYYSSGGIKSGLTEDGTKLLLNGKSIQVISGAVHYFRVHPDYWRTTLRKLKACGMNAVETYVPWNLHEPVKDKYDFGDGDFDMSMFLDVKKFLTIAKEEELFVIIRPGPYICSEWDFGGLPSYLLRDPKMRVRTSYPGYLERVDKYFKQLIPILQPYQWMPGNPGPIIAAQIENEYGSFLKESEGQTEKDNDYLAAVKDMITDNGLNSTYMFFSDSIGRTGLLGGLDGVLMTANFQGTAKAQLSELAKLQPERPIWVMEMWSGWFDHWFEDHSTRPLDTTLRDLDIVLNRYNGSVSFYMFQGGTTFGFLNGANMEEQNFTRYAPDTTSYDYDAPLTESGDYGPKYDAVCDFISAKTQNPKFSKPEKPMENPKFAPDPVELKHYLTLDDVLLQDVPLFQERSLVNMENLGASDQEAQDYGFILYRKRIVLPKGDVNLTLATSVHDMATVMIDGVHQIPPARTRSETAGVGYWLAKNASLIVKGEGKEVMLDFLAENLGRVNYGSAEVFANQRKGLVGGQVLLDGEPLTGDWEIRPLPFKAKWVKKLRSWRPKPAKGFPSNAGPKLLRGQLVVEGKSPVPDTWIHLWAEKGDVWKKGVVFVNGFNLGRYWDVGPQRTLYLPGPLLKPGLNEIISFEVYQPGNLVSFSNVAIFGMP